MDDNSSFTKRTQKYEIDYENKDNSDKSKLLYYLITQ